MTDEAAVAIARGLKWSMAYTREFLSDLESLGVHVIYRETTGELCPCGYHYSTESGLCVKCETERELERQREADEEERRRLEEEAERAKNLVKKQRQRMREEFGANPRKRKEVEW